MKKILYFSSFLIIFFIFLVMYFDLVNQNKELFNNKDATEEVIFQNCSNKYYETKINENYRAFYTGISLINNIGNLKCINSMVKIDHNNKIVYISFVDEGILNLIKYILILISFSFKKFYRFKVLFTIYLGIIMFDFYNFGFSFLGYPDIFPILLLSYFYHEN